MSLRRTALPALLLVALSVLVVAPLAAGAKPHATRIVVSLKFPAFHGSLKSGDDGCKGGRTVKMFRKKAGQPAKRLGSDASNAKGKWAIPVGKRLTSGSYFATVTAKGECRGAKSQVLTID
jgi:hypothetical protein